MKAFKTSDSHLLKALASAQETVIGRFNGLTVERLNGETGNQKSKSKTVSKSGRPGQWEIMIMNRNQKICLWIGIIVIVLSGIYPHWMIIIESPVRGESGFIGMGRHFLLHQYHKQWQIDTSRLSVQWVIVAVITGGLVVTFADKKDKKPKEEQKE